MERSLARLRANKHWSLQHAATLLEVDVSTLHRWEAGKTLPRDSSIEKLCTVYECSEEELGLLSISPSQQGPPSSVMAEMRDAASSFLATRPYHASPFAGFLPLSAHQRQREAIKRLEELSMNDDPINRRDALRRLATLPLLTLHLNALAPTLTAPPQDVLSHCSAGVIACWYLRKGKELSLDDSAVSAYIPTLQALVASSSQYRKAAADLLVQCYLLKAALSWNITTPLDGIGYAQHAEQYSKLAESPLLLVASLRSQAAARCYANQWGQALQAGQHAQYVMETTSKELIPALAQSYVYAGVATYHAYQGHQQDALFSLKKAHTSFFAQTATEVVPLWIDHSVGNLLLNDGLTHAHLGLYKSAVDSFAQVEQKYSTDPAIPVGCRTEIQIEQVLAEVSRGDQGRDMDKCIALWTEGMTGAKSLQSNKHYTDALAAYTAMKAAWPREGRIHALRDHTIHW